MNPYSFINKFGKLYLRTNNKIDLKILLFLSLFILIPVDKVFCQKSIWRYVTTIYGGDKGYLNDEIKTLANGNKSAWEKMIMSDGSFAIALIEWDCLNKSRLTKQVTFYKSDQTIIGTSKKLSQWAEVIPGSASDFMFARVCLDPQPVKWAQIISLKANLRNFPDASAPITRVADQGDKFQIVPETGKGGWYNVVDTKTQQDYWIHGNTFEIIETIPIKQEPKKKKLSPKNINPKRKGNSSRKQKN